MTRTSIALILFASAAMGAGTGVLVLQVSGPDMGRENVRSVTGVGSGVEGRKEKDLETVEEVAQSEAVELAGVEGNEGVTEESENTVEVFTSSGGAMQSIRGIKGIDTVVLQNLEAVLRMQAPPVAEGNGRAAAALLTQESDAPPDPEAEPDGREELKEFELEGS